MSLINEMLHNLEKRHKHKPQQMAVVGPVMPAKTDLTGGKILGVAATVVLLLGLVWGGFSLLPSMSAEKTSAGSSPAEQIASITATEQQQSITISPTTVTKEKYSAPLSTVFSEMTLKKIDDGARLFLNFTRPPQYSLVQSGRGNVPLIIAFTKTTMGKHLEIPEVVGSVLERIRLQPGETNLRLLVDLTAGTELEGFEVLENSETEYSLVIDFVQQIETIKPNIEKLSYPLAPLVAEKISDANQEAETAANAQTEQNVATPPPKQETVLTKKERQPSRDKQIYQIGLEQLHRGELEAAARSFSSALAINPAHTRVRLQLVATLQQLKQPEQAAQQMRQGLELLPENRVLRKEYARYLLNNRQISEAIELLRQYPVPAVASDLEYHALLAALLQQSGQYSDAAKMYTRLLQIHPGNGIWWLGLAVAMDQNGNFDQAREAYQQALTLPGMEKNSREYIKNRLEVLSEGVVDGW